MLFRNIFTEGLWNVRLSARPAGRPAGRWSLNGGGPGVGLPGRVVTMRNMKCTRRGGDDNAKKARKAVTGIVFIVAGLAACSVLLDWSSDGHRLL